MAEYIVKSIIKVAQVKFGDSILEIGPGTGNLTEKILTKSPKKIFVVEVTEYIWNI